MFKHPDLIAQVIDALEEVKTPAKQTFNAMVVASPSMMDAVQADMGGCLPRLPRIINWAHRDEVNRTLGRAGERWAIALEQKRLCEAGRPELFQKLEWVSDTLGDGTGYDIVSHDALEKPRYIEVKTTNGGHGSLFVISPNQLEFATEHEDAFLPVSHLPVRPGTQALHAPWTGRQSVAPGADRLPSLVSTSEGIVHAS